MRKLFLISSIVLFSILSVQSQERGDVELGILGGLNVSNLSGLEDFYTDVIEITDSESDYRSRIGANFGLSVDYYFLDKFSLRAKLLYDSKGAIRNKYLSYSFFDESYGRINTTEETKETYRLNYFSLPVMASFHFGFSESKNFNLNLGPYVSFLIGGIKYDVDYDLDLKLNDGTLIPVDSAYKQTIDENAKKKSDLITKELRERYSEFDFGLAFGLGYKFNLSDKLGLLVEYEGQAGLSDIYKAKAEDRVGYDNNDVTIKNFRHSFNIGLVFKL